MKTKLLIITLCLAAYGCSSKPPPVIQDNMEDTAEDTVKNPVKDVAEDAVEDIVEGLLIESPAGGTYMLGIWDYDRYFTGLDYCNDVHELGTMRVFLNAENVIEYRYTGYELNTITCTQEYVIDKEDYAWVDRSYATERDYNEKFLSKMRLVNLVVYNVALEEQNINPNYIESYSLEFYDNRITHTNTFTTGSTTHIRFSR